MRPPIGSEFRLYFERTLGVGCGVGVVLALPGVLLVLLVPQEQVLTSVLPPLLPVLSILLQLLHHTWTLLPH